MKYLLNSKSNGFTLLEVIVTILIVAVVGTMLVTLTGGILRQSVGSATRMIPMYALYQKMDAINAAYRSDFGHIAGSEIALENLKSEIDSGEFNDSAGTVTAEYIEIDASGDGKPSIEAASGTSAHLKVTISPPADATATSLTTIFSRSD